MIGSQGLLIFGWVHVFVCKRINMEHSYITQLILLTFAGFFSKDLSINLLSWYSDRLRKQYSVREKFCSPFYRLLNLLRSIFQIHCSLVVPNKFIIHFMA